MAVDIFYNVVKQDITVVRGDTLSFGFMMTGLDGNLPNSIKFSVKDNPDETETLFSAGLDSGEIWRENWNLNTATFGVRIPPRLTEGLTPGRYFYDLEVRINDEVFTFMKGRFVVEYDITR